jgi:ABC-type multidrug transport system permease subunit
MSFSSMVVFMVKWAIATIPALIILTVVGSILLGILRIIFGGFHPGMGMRF